MTNALKYFFSVFAAFLFYHADAQETQVKYLSGTGNDNTVDWQFYCTAGRNSGKWTTIPVPSNWELQGFGKYNYGLDKDSVRGKEKGLYKYAFKVPAGWKGKKINIVFEGSMTDTEVKINGKSAGPIHQGAFYEFKYDITRLVKYNKSNLLEVSVSKHSANESVNGAERRADFWIFGGIFRPVYLEALPKENIKRIALDAKANGNFAADIYLGERTGTGIISAQIYTMDGKKTGNAFNTDITNGDTVVRIQTTVADPLLWSPEFPNLYKVVITLSENGKTVHTIQQRFGFRTIELRERDGIYVNGVKIKFRGVCRHSFWPSSGRTMSKTLSIQDVQLMKDMNMNAVRMSHYPPDGHFLDACDSLGLFVLDELTGWHHYYDTEVGTKLVKEMIAKDVNHPSIIIWDNGNEGGHNFDLDPVFDSNDIQRRPVIHPWQVFRGTDTQHYINYDYGNGTHLHGHNIVFPTEFLHGLYDGGHGAGLDDFWKQMWQEPLSAGGFLWDLADEAVVRTDKNGALDADGNHGPDGIVGPYHEKEGSYFAIKEIWAPVFFERREITPFFDGIFEVENRFSYTNLKECRFTWKLARMPLPDGEDSATASGNIPAPDILPYTKGKLQLPLPADWKRYDVLYVTAYDPHQREIFTWSWPISRPEKIAAKIIKKESNGAIDVSQTDSAYNVAANGVHVTFNKKTGMLTEVRNAKGIIPFNNGPVLIGEENNFKNFTQRWEGKNLVIESSFDKKNSYNTLQWTIFPSGWIKMTVKYFPAAYETLLSGLSFSYPETKVTGVRMMADGPYRVWKNRMKGTSLNVWEKRYNNTSTGEPPYVYPEFKGYYSHLYWMKLLTKEQPVTVVCNNEDVFLRLFTPKFSVTPFNTAPPFPSGDISFMSGIPAIGTKSQKPEKLGPQGQLNMYYDYGKDRSYAKEITLFFNFSGK